MQELVSTCTKTEVERLSVVSPFSVTGHLAGSEKLMPMLMNRELDPDPMKRRQLKSVPGYQSIRR